MKQHEFISSFHCPDCWDSAVENVKNVGSDPTPYLVSLEQFPFIKEHGLAEGMLKWAKIKRELLEQEEK